MKENEEKEQVSSKELTVAEEGIGVKEGRGCESWAEEDVVGVSGKQRSREEDLPVPGHYKKGSKECGKQGNHPTASRQGLSHPRRCGKKT